MSLLTLTGIGREIGAVTILSDVSVSVAAGERIGLVGPNGAGKTTLFKTLGGDNDPTKGNILRKGGYGYLSQDPRAAGQFDGRLAVNHILSGRNIDEDLTRLEKLRIGMEENASEANILLNSTGCKFIKPNGIQLLEPLTVLPITKVSNISKIPMA
jgi:ATPase subunit of ABC transporter with duplicated ATPase domains